MAAIKAVWINGHLVRQRLHALGISERELARRTGLTSTSMRSIVSRNALSTTLSIADVRRIACELGITWGDLLDCPPASSTSGTDDDVRLLVQVLAGQRRAHQPDRLARALGWDLTRLRTVRGSANGELAAIGLTIQRASTGYILRPAKDAGDVERRLELLRDDEEGLNHSAAQALLAALNGTLSKQQDRNDQIVQLGRLHNLGALVDQRPDKGFRHELSPDTAYCLDF